ncbi:MAG: hypothetical protein QF886_18340 [Planctomycetota bacterium]|jgi:hypothetical protein|nr:hypothetical protein [Planctomycetota bacterium]
MSETEAPALVQKQTSHLKILMVDDEDVFREAGLQVRNRLGR